MQNENDRPVGPGGNSQITNQDEKTIMAAFMATIPVRSGPLSMEDDSHVTEGYHDADVAGS